MSERVDSSLGLGSAVVDIAGSADGGTQRARGATRARKVKAEGQLRTSTIVAAATASSAPPKPSQAISAPPSQTKAPAHRRSASHTLHQPPPQSSSDESGSSPDRLGGISSLSIAAPASTNSPAIKPGKRPVKKPAQAKIGTVRLQDDGPGTPVRPQAHQPPQRQVPQHDTLNWQQSLSHSQPNRLDRPAVRTVKTAPPAIPHTLANHSASSAGLSALGGRNWQEELTAASDAAASLHAVPSMTWQQELLGSPSGGASSRRAHASAEPVVVDDVFHNGSSSSSSASNKRQPRQHTPSQASPKPHHSSQKAAAAFVVSSPSTPGAVSPPSHHYAGPTFHNSPAPSTLPAPKIMSKLGMGSPFRTA